MGFMDKLKEVKQKATEIWDEAAENRAKMKAEEEAASDPILEARIANLKTLGSVSGGNIQPLTDKSFRTSYAYDDGAIIIYNEKTNIMGGVAKRLYVIEFDAYNDVAEFRFDHIYGDSSYYFVVVLKDGTEYKLCCYLRRFSDSENNGTMRVEENKSWFALFHTVGILMIHAKEEATREWINNFYTESGGEAVFKKNEPLDQGLVARVEERIMQVQKEWVRTGKK